MSALTTPVAANSNVAELIDGKAHSRALIMDPAGVDAVGAVGAAPAANTLLGRLKAVADAIISLAGLTSSADSFKGLSASNTVLNPIPKAIYVTTEGTITVEGADGNSETFALDAKSILPIRPRKITAATATGIKALY